MLEMVDRLLPAANVSTLLEIQHEFEDSRWEALHVASHLFQPFLRFNAAEAFGLAETASLLFQPFLRFNCRIAILAWMDFVAKFQPFLRFNWTATKGASSHGGSHASFNPS